MLKATSRARAQILQKHAIIAISSAAATGARHSDMGKIMAWSLPFEERS
jgi:hypothetical protein